MMGVISFCDAVFTGSVEEALFAVGADELGGRPLCTHSTIAVTAKLTAISMALGRYVPILTKRFAWKRR